MVPAPPKPPGTTLRALLQTVQERDGRLDRGMGSLLTTLNRLPSSGGEHPTAAASKRTNTLLGGERPTETHDSKKETAKPKASPIAQAWPGSVRGMNEL